MQMLFMCVALFSLLQLSSSIINCRISCRRCRERTDHPELVEVYCAMCDECKERRKEWLRGAPSLSLKNEESNFLQTDHQDSEDCFPPLCEDPCEDPPPVPLTGSLESTIVTTTTTTTTTTSTTRRPCPPKPKCAKPCAVPMIPIMPMCSMCNVNPISSANVLNDHTKKKSVESMYLYLGVPKKLLNELNMENKI